MLLMAPLVLHLTTSHYIHTKFRVHTFFPRPQHAHGRQQTGSEHNFYHTHTSPPYTRIAQTMYYPVAPDTAGRDCFEHLPRPSPPPLEKPGRPCFSICSFLFLSSSASCPLCIPPFIIPSAFHRLYRLHRQKISKKGPPDDSFAAVPCSLLFHLLFMLHNTIHHGTPLALASLFRTILGEDSKNYVPIVILRFLWSWNFEFLVFPSV